MQLRLSSTGPNGVTAGTNVSRPLRVLFIGNSYTARNDLPARVRLLARALGHSFEYRLIAAGGASLKRHWNAAGTITVVNEGWDICVLQEQSTLPIRNQDRYFESVRLFDHAIHAAGARTALYLPWHRQSEPDDWFTLSDAVLSIAWEIDATVVPVGLAWRIALARDPALPLYASDGSHPTVFGTTLAALTFVRCLLGELPTLRTPLPGVAPDAVPLLREAAQLAVEQLEQQTEPA